MDSVVHFEIPAANMKRAERFYRKVFGWKTHRYMDAYYLAETTPTDRNRMPTRPGAINGALQRKDKSIASSRVVVHVGDLDRALKHAAASGGKVKQPRTEVPGILWYAVILDTEGNEVGLAEYMRK